jgi:hypothetical protein
LGERTIASMPRAAALRNRAPRLVWVFRPSRTASRRAPARSSSREVRVRRWNEARMPRWTWKPVTDSRTSGVAV